MENKFGSSVYPDSEITGKIIGLCMEVHRQLGHGFLEIVYKDALESELIANDIPFTREKKFEIMYKGKKLAHYYFADFLVGDGCIVEIKAQNGIADENYKQVINYLAVSGCEVGLILNFAGPSLTFKRVVLSKKAHLRKSV